MKRKVHKILVVGLVVVAALLVEGTSLRAGTPAPSDIVKLALGKADTVDLPGEVADILVADPAIADVGALRSDRLYVVGRAVGDTNVLAFDDSGNLLAHIDVHVRIDENTLRKTLIEFFPKEKIQARTVNEDVVLTGRVSSPAVANQVRDMATRFIGENQTVMDLMTVAGEQQVLLRVRIMEANRSALREIGVDTDITLDGDILNDGSSITALGGGNLATAGDIIGLTQSPFAQGVLANLSQGIFGDVDARIEGLERRGLVNTLAEPNLTAISGENAGFLAGGEFPVPTGIDNNGNVVIEFRPFGVSLMFTPTVLSGDRISLQLRTEVSSLVESDGITLQNVEIPGLSVRRAETTVQLGSGGGLMIAGLLKSEMTRAMNSLPGIADIPILGELFKSRSFDQEESELLIMVSVLLVQPYAEQMADLQKEDMTVTSAAKTVAMTAAAPKGVGTVAAVAPAPEASSEMSSMVDMKAETVSSAPVPIVNTAVPLEASFSENLQRVYGKKIPASLSASSGYGYILE